MSGGEALLVHRGATRLTCIHRRPSHRGAQNQAPTKEASPAISGLHRRHRRRKPTLLLPRAKVEGHDTARAQRLHLGRRRAGLIRVVQVFTTPAAASPSSSSLRHVGSDLRLHHPQTRRPPSPPETRRHRTDKSCRRKEAGVQLGDEAGASCSSPTPTPLPPRRRQGAARRRGQRFTLKSGTDPTRRRRHREDAGVRSHVKAASDASGGAELHEAEEPICNPAVPKHALTCEPTRALQVHVCC